MLLDAFLCMANIISKYIGGVPIDFNFILKTISEHYAVETCSVMVG